MDTAPHLRPLALQYYMNYPHFLLLLIRLHGMQLIFRLFDVLCSHLDPTFEPLSLPFRIAPPENRFTSERSHFRAVPIHGV